MIEKLKMAKFEKANSEIEELLRKAKAKSTGPIPCKIDDKFTFSSGATSGGKQPNFFIATWEGFKRTALRFQAGNRKHENYTTILADANWLKAFHSRDLEFFRDRASHAMTHIFEEMQGRFDSDPGGNWGAVGWAVEVMSYVSEYDPAFYRAIVGLVPHPGQRLPDDLCACPRCTAGEAQ